MMPKQKVLLLASSAAFYAVLWFGAEIYGSYRYEPSGVQYVLLPVAALACFVVAVAIWLSSSRTRSNALLVALSFAAVPALAVPPFAMPLSDQNLEAGRLATIAVGVIHALLLIIHLLRSPTHDVRPDEAGA